MFARDSQSALAERLAELGDSGARRLDSRMAAIAANMERQREEFLQTLEQRLGEAERDLRERTAAAILEGEAQRGALEARLAELGRRIEDALEEAEQRLATLDRLS
jgi:recombinational DNA repair ATPase RecF